MGSLFRTREIPPALLKLIEPDETKVPSAEDEARAIEEAAEK